MAVNNFCYYTPEELAVCILKLIGKVKINTAIDICCGQGALLRAAERLFPGAALIGVDILDDDFHKELKNCTFMQSDGFDFVKENKGTYDLILSNPPFGYSKEVKMEGIKELNRKRIECQMMNANLSLMHSKSWMMIVLPSTIITGVTCKSIRRELAHCYKIHSVVQLPDDTFGSHLIKTFAVLLNGRIDNKPTKFYYAVCDTKRWKLQETKEIAFTKIQKGDWYVGETTTGRLDVTVFRGVISSRDFSDDGAPVYHCATKNKLEWQPSIRYTRMKYDPEKVARKGDIIINRIGRFCGYWCVCQYENICISDCIIVIRKTEGIVEKMKENSINGRLDIPSRGVATKYVTKGDIINKLANVN